LILSANYESELYDLENDPAEEKNIINEKPEVAAELRQKIDTWRQSFKQAEIKNVNADFDEAVRKRLEALGYLG